MTTSACFQNPWPLQTRGIYGAGVIDSTSVDCLFTITPLPAYWPT
jgi:hypothetical protein